MFVLPSGQSRDPLLSNMTRKGTAARGSFHTHEPSIEGCQNESFIDNGVISFQGPQQNDKTLDLHNQQIVAQTLPSRDRRKRRAALSQGRAGKRGRQLTPEPQLSTPAQVSLVDYPYVSYRSEHISLNTHLNEGRVCLLPTGSRFCPDKSWRWQLGCAILLTSCRLAPPSPTCIIRTHTHGPLCSMLPRAFDPMHGVLHVAN